MRNTTLEKIYIDNLINQVKERIEDFVKNDLKGRYSKHCSDEFLIAYIEDAFEKSYHKKYLNVECEVAYHAVVHLFESILEYGCRTGVNGHHVAQWFAKKFSYDEQFKMK